MSVPTLIVAGAAVTRDVPEMEVWGGVRAKWPRVRQAKPRRFGGKEDVGADSASPDRCRAGVEP